MPKPSCGCRAFRCFLFDSHIEARSGLADCDNGGDRSHRRPSLRNEVAPCYVDLPEINSTGRERREAYVAAMQAAGSSGRVLSGRSGDKIGAESPGPPGQGGFPSTILCGNDRLVGLLSQLYKAGVAVGRDQTCGSGP